MNRSRHEMQMTSRDPTSFGFS